MSARAVVFTISDRCARGAVVDQSGPAVIEMLPLLDAGLVHREIIPDNRTLIQKSVQTWTRRADLIITTGGTGVALRDVTPEALAPLIERGLPGFGELMRLRAYDRTPTSIVSRAGAGISGDALVIWLPGSPKAVRECLEWLAPAVKHVSGFLQGEPPH